MKLLMEIAAECRNLYDKAVIDLGPDLMGSSVLDLCADNMPEESLRCLQDAITVSGIPAICNERLRQQIAKYATLRAYERLEKENRKD
jgi:hypothetical protein